LLHYFDISPTKSLLISPLNLAKFTARRNPMTARPALPSAALTGHLHWRS
jgi:hypothetical protein